MTSLSLKNFIKRVEKKERQTPSTRAKRGLVERKKDYKVRAEQSHAKERLITTLKWHASQKNPDEFYHAMENMRTHGGLLVSVPPSSQLKDPNDAIPDVILDAAAKKLQKEREDTAMRLPNMSRAKHIVFCDNTTVNVAQTKKDEPMHTDADAGQSADLKQNLALVAEKIGKIEQEIARREAQARAQKSSPAYRSKQEIGLDTYGNKIYKLQQRRCR